MIWLKAQWRRFLSGTQGVRGVAAVEFALIAPAMVLIYVAVVDLSDGVMTSRKVSEVARTLVDLTSRQSTTSMSVSTPTPANALTSDTLLQMVTSSQTLLSPQSPTGLTQTISAIDVTNQSNGVCCSALVRWSYTQNGTLRPCGVQITGVAGSASGPTVIPASLLPTGTTLSQPLSYLVSDVSYTYQPLISGGNVSFSIPMSRVEYSLPRSSGQVVTGPLPASGSTYGQVCY